MPIFAFHSVSCVIPRLLIGFLLRLMGLSYGGMQLFIEVACLTLLCL